MLDLDALLDANISFHGVLIQDDGQRTRALTALLDNGTLRPAVSHLHPLEAAARHTGSWGAGTPAARSSSTSRAAKDLQLWRLRGLRSRGFRVDGLSSLAGASGDG